jgi:hypothetical protein
MLVSFCSFAEVLWWKGTNLRKPEKQQQLGTQLLIFEKKRVVHHAKFGLLYRKAGQTEGSSCVWLLCVSLAHVFRAENEVYSNEHGSPQFVHFLGLISNIVPLKGHTGFRGGLDTKVCHLDCHDCSFVIACVDSKQPCLLSHLVSAGGSDGYCVWLHARSVRRAWRTNERERRGEACARDGNHAACGAVAALRFGQPVSTLFIVPTSFVVHVLGLFAGNSCIESVMWAMTWWWWCFARATILSIPRCSLQTTTTSSFWCGPFPTIRWVRAVFCLSG